MLVFPKITVQSHVSKHTLSGVRTRQARRPWENIPGTSVHCKILENFVIPDMYVVGGSGFGGLILAC